MKNQLIALMFVCLLWGGLLIFIRFRKKQNAEERKGIVGLAENISVRKMDELDALNETIGRLNK